VTGVVDAVRSLSYADILTNP